MTKFQEMIGSRMSLRLHVALELNSDYYRIPSFFRGNVRIEPPRTKTQALIEFNREIIKATKSFVGAYILKPENYLADEEAGLFTLMCTMMDVRIEAKRVPLIFDTRETPIQYRKIFAERIRQVPFDGLVLDPNRMNWEDLPSGVISNRDIGSSKIRDVAGEKAIVYIEGHESLESPLEQLILDAQNSSGTRFLVGVGDNALYTSNERRFAEATTHTVLTLTDAISRCLEVRCTTCGSKMHTEYGNWVCENKHHTTPFT